MITLTDGLLAAITTLQVAGIVGLLKIEHRMTQVETHIAWLMNRRRKNGEPNHGA
jgi:hypothetical protein